MKSSQRTCASKGSYAVGGAWKGSLCYNNSYSVDGGSNNGKGFRTSINAWVTSDLGLASVINTAMPQVTRFLLPKKSAQKLRISGFWDPIQNCVSARSGHLEAAYLKALLYTHLM